MARIRRNTLYNALGQVLPPLVALLTVPPYLHLIGASRYGVLAIVWILLGYFGLFDLAIGRSVAQHIARMGASDRARQATAVWTATILSGVLGAVGALILWGSVELLFSRIFPDESGLSQEVYTALPWLVLLLPVTVVGSALSGALHGLERFLALNAGRFYGYLAGQFVPLATAWLLGPTLNLLFAAVLVARISSLLLHFFLLRSNLAASAPQVDRPTARALLGFGKWVSVSSAINPILTSVDSLLIGGMAGPAAVTHYTVPMGLVSRIGGLSASLSNALFPRFASAEAEERDALSGQAVRALAALVTPGLVVALFLLAPFLSVWISPEFSAVSAPAGLILLMGVWANSLAQIPYSQLQAQGRPDLVAKVHASELVPYVVLLVVLLHFWGIVGAAAAWSIRVTIDGGLLLHLSGVLKQRLRARFLLFPGLLVVAAWVSAVFPWQAVWMKWAVAGVLLFVSGGWAWRAAPAAMKEALTGRGFFNPS